jgi:DNA-binding response OmpR family regulator
MADESGAAGRILVVEDDEVTAASLSAYLRHGGYAVELVGDGRTGLARALSGEHDLLVLDLMLPGLDGLDLCRQLRKAGSVLPVIALTARTTEHDRVVGLELGADDYVSKPFSPRELVARVRAVLRRTTGPATLIRAGDLRIDRGAQRVWVGREEVRLTATEMKILFALVSSPGRVLSRSWLLERVLGRGADERVIDVHVKNLRRKIEAGDRPAVIETVHGLGYRFVLSETAP